MQAAIRNISLSEFDFEQKVRYHLTPCEYLFSCIGNFDINFDLTGRIFSESTDQL
jgi:hypothetical protein